MSDAIITKYEALLNEEKWTRATINNYSIKNFEETNDLIEEFEDYHIISEINEINEEYLKNNKNSILALYVSSIFQCKEGSLDNNNTYNLLKIFVDNMKWNIVEYLSEKFLANLDDKFILRTLIDAYTNLNKKEDLPPLWERLVKIDYEEANIVVKLAEMREEKEEIDEAISYYKKAANRYIHNKNFNKLEEIWRKLLTFNSIPYDFYLNLDKKITNNFSIERSIDLLTQLYEVHKKNDDFDICLRILKLILEKDAEDDYSRDEIVGIYRKKFTGHSHLDEYIRKSNLEGRWRNIHEAILSFEKHIAFDVGNFVHHRTWGIGVIKKIEKDMFFIDFQKEKNHKMSLKVALNSLKVLPKSHIWLLKLKNIKKLKEKVKSDVDWALKVLIKSYNNKATMKNFKAELVPDVLTNSEWNTWWNNGKKILKTDPLFGTLDEDNNIFELRDKPLSFEEKIFNSFKASKDFNQRFALIVDYIENAEPDSDFLEEMTNYFTSFINSTYNINEQTFISYILLKNIEKKFPFAKITFNYEFKDFIDELEDLVPIYEKINTSDFKKDFLLYVMKNYSKWEDTYLRIFYLYPNKFIFDELTSKKSSYLEKIIRDSLAAYKEYREAFFWLVSNIINDKIISQFNIDYDNIVFCLIHLIELTGKDIGIRKDTVKNKKISNQIKDYLFKNDFLPNYIEKSEKDFAKRLYSITSELLSMDGEYIVKIKNKISEKFPDIDTEDKSLKFDTSSAKTSIMDKLIITKQSYNKVKREIQNIKDVEIPDNSKEIGLAMEKGDLKENAEFKAAKERQQLLQNRITKLMNDLSKAVIVAREDVKDSFVTFGTTVELEDNIEKKSVTYTILGPWESDTEKNIISYQSPLGAKLIDKKVNEEIQFELNGKEYHYILRNISIADF